MSSGELSALLEKHRTDLAGKGKVLIDTSNPYSAAYWGSKHELPPEPYQSAVEYHADVLGDTSTAWASGFKCLIPPDLGHQRITEVCGDLRAKALLSSLFEILGRSVVGWYASNRRAQGHGKRHRSQEAPDRTHAQTHIHAHTQVGACWTAEP